MSTRPVYVVGHRNPDTDSIAAAIGYAELKQILDPDVEFVPARLGDLNPQTTWAIEQAEAELPVLLSHVRLRAQDIMRSEFPAAHQEDSVRSAGQLMARGGLDLLPVVDSDGVLAGVLTERALARRYVRESQEASHLEAQTSVATIATTLDGEMLFPGGGWVSGRIWVISMSVDTMLGEAVEGDIAVVGDREDAQRKAIEADTGLVVLSNGVRPSAEMLALAEEHDTAIIVTPLDSYVAGRMITLSSPCHALIEREPLTARRSDLVADIADEVKDVSYRAAVVVDRARTPVGLVTRADLVDPEPRRVLLVDHAESAQAVDGVEQAEIVEILDHHHIGSIETKLPVVATFDPVGSTSTLIVERFLGTGREPSRSSAIMLLAAVLSDTVLLNSPTTTDRDRRMIDYLGDLLKMDPMAFGREMFESTTDFSGVSADDIVKRDAKSYEVAGEQTLCIAQIEIVGDTVNGRMPELVEAAEAAAKEGRHRLFALMVTDILSHGTRLVVAGDVQMAERAFDARAEDGVIDLPNVMSRKKQVAPKLLAVA